MPLAEAEREAMGALVSRCVSSEGGEGRTRSERCFGGVGVVVGEVEGSAGGGDGSGSGGSGEVNLVGIA